MVIVKRYAESPEYSYAAGQPKFSQAVNGVQTVHSYESTTLHDAIRKHSVITKANGELVAAQNRKTEELVFGPHVVENRPFGKNELVRSRGLCYSGWCDYG